MVGWLIACLVDCLIGLVGFFWVVDWFVDWVVELSVGSIDSELCLAKVFKVGFLTMSVMFFSNATPSQYKKLIDKQINREDLFLEALDKVVLKRELDV